MVQDLIILDHEKTFSDCGKFLTLIANIVQIDYFLDVIEIKKVLVGLVAGDGFEPPTFRL